MAEVTGSSPVSPTIFISGQKKSANDHYYLILYKERDRNKDIDFERIENIIP